MQLPSEVPVMTLPDAILFPQAMLPLYIFEKRYRRMLSDALNSHRMFTVAMRKPGRRREIPSHIAGLGLIRASVANKDGTSHLILQGLARVELAETVQYKPYRIQRIRPLQTVCQDSVVVDALTAKVLELVSERLSQGFDLPVQVIKTLGQIEAAEEIVQPSAFSLKEVLQHLAKLENPDYLADLVSCTLLPDALERQTILETPHLEMRLKLLLQFLIAEIRRNRKNRKA